MSMYHCHISYVSRAKGSSAVATASYITGQRLRCERTGELYDYGRKQRVVDVATYLPAHAPSEWSDPAQLFNAIENFDSRKNSRVARKIEVALPREFDLELQKKVTADFCSQLTKRGYACTCALHTDKDNNNPHAHILVANRKVNNKGQFVKTTTKTVAKLDERGNRIPLIDPETGKQKLDKRNRKQWQRKTIQYNWLDERKVVKELRKSWADECNKHLSQEDQISEKKLKEQGLPYSKPTIHEGYKARAMERKGEVSEICEYNRDVKKNRAKILKLIALIAREKKREAKQQERHQQIEHAVVLANDVVTDTVAKAGDAIKNTGHKMLKWWQNVAQPALVDAITPTEIDHAHNEEWDNFQEMRHIEKQQARLSELNKQEREILRHGNNDDLRWFDYQHKEEMNSLRKEVNAYREKHTAKPKYVNSDIEFINGNAKSSKRPMSVYELQQMAQEKKNVQECKLPAELQARAADCLKPANAAEEQRRARKKAADLNQKMNESQWASRNLPSNKRSSSRSHSRGR